MPTNAHKPRKSSFSPPSCGFVFSSLYSRLVFTVRTRTIPSVRSPSWALRIRSKQAVWEGPRFVASVGHASVKIVPGLFCCSAFDLLQDCPARALAPLSMPRGRAGDYVSQLHNSLKPTRLYAMASFGVTPESNNSKIHP